MKNLLFLLFIFSFLFPQFNYKNINTSGAMGSATIDGEIYNQVAIRPEIPIGKLGIGLDINLYFNDSGIYKGNWNFDNSTASYRTIIDKIYYLRWGQPGEPLYFRIGSLEQISLGHGILVKNYSNTMQYPEVKRIGLDYRMQIKHNIGVDIIHSNFKNKTPGLIAGRVWYDLSPKIQIALSVSGDANQNSGLLDDDGDDVPNVLDDFPSLDGYIIDSDGDGLADNDPLESDVDGDGLDNWNFDEDGSIVYWDWSTQDSIDFVEMSGFLIDPDGPTDVKRPYYLTENIADIYGYALDFSYKITNKIKLYGQYGILDDNGWGFSFPAIHTKIGILDLRAEYRQCSDRFMYSYWDKSYDLTRANLSDGNIITKSDDLENMISMKGYFLDAVFNLFDYAWMEFAYQDLKSNIDTDSIIKNKSFHANINISTEKIPKLEIAKAFYQRSNDADIFDFKNPSPSTVYGYDIGFKVSKGMTMVYKNRITYKKDATNKIISVPVMQIETQMKF